MAILASALIGVYLLNGHLGFLNAALSIFDGATSFPLIAIPLFILAGALMNTGGISTRLIAFVSALIGFVRGGLAMVNVGVFAVLRRDLGIGGGRRGRHRLGADPGDEAQGLRPPQFAAAITSSSASLAIIIPPSIPMILYGALSDTSIVQLFVGRHRAGGWSARAA